MITSRFARHCFAAMVCAALTSCAGIAPPPDRPRLVVFLVVDGLPQWQVLAYRDQLAPDGLARFLDRGAWLADAHHGHAVTATAPGHAALLTGAYPNRTGIIGNEWPDLNTGAEIYNTGDSSATYIGHKTRVLDGTSPKNLKVETVGDILRRVDARSKVISIAGKDRGAILLAGRSGTAYIYMDASGQFASSTFYMAEHPDWVNAFNVRKPADRYFKTEWKPLLPEAAYARSVPDNQPWFGLRGGKLPMMMGVAADDAPGPAFYGALLKGPFVDALSLEFARAAIAGERLGRDDAPDILTVSLSGHDYVNHAYSAESRISHDHLLQLDRQFQAFFGDLDAMIGGDNYIAVLTSDHGFMPAPEYSQSQGRAAGRLSRSQTLGRINAELERSFGAPKLAIQLSAFQLLLDRKLIAQKGLDFDAVAETARATLVAVPAIAAAYTRRELEEGSRAGAPFFEEIHKSWNKDVSGDVQFVIKPFWMSSSSTSVATHGSPHPYDNHVPILVYGPKWVRPGRVDGHVDAVDIAPTLARWLGVPAPAASEGRLLPLRAP
ncbi:MAG: alkaline phosphatase family protein [Ramlibacter sp.]